MQPIGINFKTVSGHKERRWKPSPPSFCTCEPAPTKHANEFCAMVAVVDINGARLAYAISDEDAAKPLFITLHGGRGFGTCCAVEKTQHLTTFDRQP